MKKTRRWGAASSQTGLQGGVTRLSLSAREALLGLAGLMGVGFNFFNEIGHKKFLAMTGRLYRHFDKG